MIKFPKTPRLKTVLEDERLLQAWRKLDVVVSEKLDGANAGVGFSPEGKLQLQSRGHILVGGPRERQFELFKQWGHANQQALYEALGCRYVLFGEWLFAKHRIFYDALPAYFIEYDLYDREQDLYCSTARRTELTARLAIPQAPVLHHGPFGKVHNFGRLIANSAFKTPDWKQHLETLEGTDDSILMEGLYLKIEDGEQVVGRVKLVRPGFEKVREDDTDWMRRPIVRNLLRIRSGVESSHAQPHASSSEADGQAIPSGGPRDLGPQGHQPSGGRGLGQRSVG